MCYSINNLSYVLYDSLRNSLALILDTLYFSRFCQYWELDKQLESIRLILRVDLILYFARFFENFSEGGEM